MIIPPELLALAINTAWHGGAGAGDREVELVVEAVMLWLKEHPEALNA